MTTEDANGLIVALGLTTLFGASIRWPFLRQFVRAPEPYRRLVAIVGFYFCLVVALGLAVRAFA